MTEKSPTENKELLSTKVSSCIDELMRILLSGPDIDPKTTRYQIVYYQDAGASTPAIMPKDEIELLQPADSMGRLPIARHVHLHVGKKSSIIASVPKAQVMLLPGLIMGRALQVISVGEIYGHVKLLNVIVMD